MNEKLVKHMCLLFIVFWSVPGCLAGEEFVTIKFPPGALKGSKDVSRDGRQFTQFLGIPYGRVPQRFMESAEVTGWEGVHDSTDFGAECIQKGMGDEDCLFINIFTPYLPAEGQADGKLPVLVFIHGGYFVAGSGNLYGPHYFMDHEVVVVTLNYRLSVFGFLNLGIDEAPGNQGMKDQILALRWIQKYIKFFGGNESSVTIFGESAGAASVSHLLLTPMRTGLFHRAISQSGTAACAWAYNSKPEQAAMAYAKKLGCTGSDKHQILNCLNKLEAKQLLKVLPAFLGPTPSGADDSSDVKAVNFVPSLERREPSSKSTIFLPKSPVELLQEREKDNIPWILGFNSMEGFVFTSDKLQLKLNKLNSSDEVKEEFRRIGPSAFKYNGRSNQNEISDQISSFYFGDRFKIRRNISNLITDHMFLHCSVVAAGLYAKSGPAYFYEFEKNAPFSLVTFLLGGDEPPQPTHADELTFHWKFNSPFIDPDIADIGKDKPTYKFSEDFLRMWIHFAKHGEPMAEWNKKAFTWTPITSSNIDEQMCLHLNDDVALLPLDQELKSRIQFMAQINVSLAYP